MFTVTKNLNIELLSRAEICSAGFRSRQGPSKSLDLKVEDLDVPADSVQVLYPAHLQLVQGQLLQPASHSFSQSVS